MTWFLLDIAFYSQNLFLPDLLRTTGFSSFPTIPPGGSEACTGACAEAVWRGVFRSAAGNAVVALIGTVPGYWFTVFFVDKWGRVPIQFMGFGVMTGMLVLLACIYDKLVPPPGSPTVVSPWIFLWLYSTTFFFANFGPNSTTFIVPAEVFHTRFRGTLHGVSAAMGKLGAIVGVFGFGELQLSKGERRERERERRERGDKNKADLSLPPPPFQKERAPPSSAWRSSTLWACCLRFSFRRPRRWSCTTRRRGRCRRGGAPCKRSPCARWPG